VVVLPERRRIRNLTGALRGPLLTIANNGVDLIRDLEFIGRCPEGKPTITHLTKVCRSLGYWGGQKFVARRLSVGREAFSSIEPYLTVLPVDLTIALQRVESVFLVQQLQAPRVLDSNYRLFDFDPETIRNSGASWDPRSTDGKPKRFTMQGFSAEILEYYLLTEAVRAALPSHLRRPTTGGASEHVEFFAVGKANTSGYPFTHYPGTATSDTWVGPLPLNKPSWWAGDGDGASAAR
jgi:hypothetical protein